MIVEWNLSLWKHVPLNCSATQQGAVGAVLRCPVWSLLRKYLVDWKRKFVLCGLIRQNCYYNSWSSSCFSHSLLWIGSLFSFALTEHPCWGSLWTMDGSPAVLCLDFCGCHLLLWTIQHLWKTICHLLFS